jgi:hypothetical protein
MKRRSFLLVLFGSLLTTAVVHADPGTMLTLDSQPGDYIGGGQSLVFTSDDATFNASYDGSFLRVNIFPFSGSFWHVDVAAAPGEPLVPGIYEGAVRASFRGPGEPGLDVFGDGRGCNEVTGRFEVLEAVYGPLNYVTTFHAVFEQHCEGAPPALFGVIRIENPPPPPVLELGITLGGGSLNRVSGDAVIEGTVACSVNTDVFLGLNLTQRASRYVVVRGSLSTSISCAAPQTVWSVTVRGDGNIPFGAGWVEVAANASAFDPNYSQFVNVVSIQNVKLSGSKK